MKKSSPLTASHVNTGTSNSGSLSSSSAPGRLFRAPKLQVSVESNDLTATAGLALATRLSSMLRLAQGIDAHVHVLKQHRPFHESDHVLTHTFNLFLGGGCIEDIADLQQSKAAHRILGTERVPDPTTAGDFLRRFDEDSVKSLDRAIDEAQLRAWRRFYGRKKQDLGIVDIDSHVHHVYGQQKEHADFTYKGGFGFHPLAITLDKTQEVLRLINRPGNVVSADGAAEQIESLIPHLETRFRKILIRGDSAFARQAIFDVCDDHGHYFAMVSPAHVNLEAIADGIPDENWTGFRADSVPKKNCTKKRMRPRRNRRSKVARARKKRDLRLKEQCVAEVPYKPARSKITYRLIIRAQLIEEAQRGGGLFDVWRYRYVLTNLPKKYSCADVIRLTYKRCDQENIIEQLQNGVAAMRMPSGEFHANSAWLVCARLAHNLKSWLGMSVLPRETIRWEWKRFRKAFIYVAARVTRHARQVLLGISDSHRFADEFRRGICDLQT